MNEFADMRHMVEALTVQPAQYVWFKYMGPDRTLTGTEGTRFKLTKGSFYGVNPVRGQSMMTIIMKVLGPEKLFKMKPNLAYALMRLSRPYQPPKKQKAKTYRK